ncbi:protein kintoun [Periplaneta americana]|uniref:protein kintoun n=1 Tax=Periplaneta americana TaxID=6978 RepID=UPI0037E9A04D
MARKYKGTAWEDLDLSRDEVERLGEALKKEEFRKLLIEYAEEINDPENMKQYEREITELEKERGVDISFINPEPCYVIKSSVDGERKAFINICKNDKVGKPTSVPMTKSGTRGLNWSLPFTQAPPRNDVDKHGNICTVFDVVFHSETHKLAESNAQFKKMLNNTALDAVEDNFEVQLDRKNLKFPKMKYKGSPRPTVIRKKMENAPVEQEFSIPESVYPYRLPIDGTEKQARISEKLNRKRENEIEGTSNPESEYTTPVYVIKHRKPIDMQDFTNDKDAKMNATIPKELVIEVQLPLLNTSADMDLDVTHKSISLTSEKPAKYKLHLTLPYSVNEEAGTAKFIQNLRMLVITLPVRHQNDINLIDIGREDSGVESDLGRRTPETSSDEEEKVLNQNSLIEIQRNGTSLQEIASDEAYRTMSTNDNKFLKPDVHYLLPAFTCNVVDNIVAFTLHVKNVEPDSIEHCFLSEDLCGVHLCFTSIGAGFFPIHYAFCLKLPSGVSISQDTFCAEAWDNNVIVQMQLKSCVTNVMEYYVGIDEHSVVKYDLPEPAAISRKLEQLEIEASDDNKKTDLKVEVTKCTESELVVEICSDKHKKQDEIDEDDDVYFDDDTAAVSNVLPNQRCGNAEPESQLQDSKNALQNCRTMSESSGDELSFSPTKKGILKNNGRVCRSLSESSVDDYAWSSSLDMVTQSGSESCIPEETTEEERENKKTVRFNDVVSQQTYRTNSSILGQRKKNQRKTRNKKRCQERRASESENSEGEAERERERERKADIEKISEAAVDDNSVTEDETQKDDSIPAVQENSNGSTGDEMQELNGRDQATAKHSPNKGKRKNRKGLGAIQAGVTPVPQVEFGSDLIFDLDM